ncbi:Acyl-CoA-binding protein [Plasmopara halstedii]|uniref:Acyl-CoA-binding protein n=1 Tax=Plasmopara halstedii TaxID=4781 RepID=A0A0P1AVT9_PLAHL|nr:Acyl-CoA-binding protein [Plasmopara halstedii]CEG46504.1 Acyl-CoA-binding protein [Plasmopara halstedii]|eukprot:XP_024582873.1 Acyl-CoA-binding protein [Plasmopara halstedii]
MDDLTTFLNSVESSARKILKEQNKKQQQQAIRDRVALIKGSTKAAKPNQSSNRPTRDELRVTYASGGTLIFSAPESPTLSNQRSPNLFNNEVDDLNLPKLPPPRSPIASIPPGSIYKPLNLPAINRSSKPSSKLHLKCSSTLKLLESPLYKSLTALRADAGSGGTKSPGQKLKKTLQTVDNVALLFRKMGLHDSIGAASSAHRADHAVDKRMCNACWATPDKVTGCEVHSRVYPTGKGGKQIDGEAVALMTSLELQGPTSWLSDDLYIMYRSETNREKAWFAYLSLQKSQEEMKMQEVVDTKKVSLAVIPKVSRHPICELFEKLQCLENMNVQTETYKRNLTKTFIFDVNHIWLTNLDHFNNRLVKHDEDSKYLDSERHSLSDRRDYQAIREGYSQVQSISAERALKHVVSIKGRVLNHQTDMMLHSEFTDQQNPPRKKTCFYPLSLLCCGEWDPESQPNALDQVPGVALVGKEPVLWWRYDPDNQGFEVGDSPPEYTKTVGLFKRDNKLSSSNSIVVRLVLALDTPILAPKCFVWHVDSEMPPMEPENVIDNGIIRIVPVTSPCPKTLLSSPLDSILDGLLPSTITLFNNKAQEEDHWLQLTDIVGHRRGWTEFSARHSFRQWLLLTDESTLTPQYDVDMQHCSITIAHPNVPGVCGRHCWHAIDPIVNFLSRRRIENDFLYILQNHKTSGSNEAYCFTVIMNHEVMVDVIGAPLSTYLAIDANREARVAYEAKLCEIERKLAIGRQALEKKRQEQRRIEQELESTAVRADIRSKGGLNDAVEEAVALEWTQRLNGSIVIEQHGHWEMREIMVDGGGVVFFHSLNESLPVTRRFLWERPQDWEANKEYDEMIKSIETTEDSELETLKSATGTTIETGKQVNVEAQDRLVHSLLEDEHFLQQLKIKLGLESQALDAARFERHSCNVQDDDHETAGNFNIELNERTEDGMKSSFLSKEMAKLQFEHGLESSQLVKNRAEGWKRLKTSRLPPNFARSVYRTHTEGPRSSFINQTNHATPVGMLDPADCSVHDMPDFIPELRSLFVSNPSEDLNEKKLRSLRAQKTPGTPNSRVRRGAISGFELEDDSLELELSRQNDTKEQREARAVLCARNHNLEGLELILDQGVDVNTRDYHGNTLFILACQQGDKRLAKFLLRRRADMNLQNLNGNTAMHYLYAYKHNSLAEYLKKKGAKDTTQNAAGLTCYEGLSQDDVDGI